MYEITEKTLKEAYKPYDIVTDENGNVGFIQEVSINPHQSEPYQVQYAVKWLIGSPTRTAWYRHSELTRHCNLFVKIAECSCHPFGNSERWVSMLMGTGV